jgi:hypothetical protein
MIDYADLVASFEAAGGSFSLEDGHVTVTYPKDQRDALMPILSLLRAFKVDVERLVLERGKIHSAQPHTLYMGRMKKGEAKVPEAGFRPGSPTESKQSAEDIDLALKIGAYLEKLPAHQSATASQIAEAHHGRQYTLEHVIEAYQICEEMRGARILIRGRDGYGYQLARPLAQKGASG